MTVKINKPALNLREELNELNKPSGITGESLLRADTDADARTTLGIDNFEQVSVSTDGVISADGLTSSGNLLVGTTSGSRKLEVHADDVPPMRVRRNTSDGNLVEYYKDGTTVGSIGTSGGDLIVGTGNTGLLFYDATPQIIPRNTTGANVDATVDLGASGSRFKDLYLSGGVYLGGTGAANKLDDYEEGTFTPAITFGGASVGLTYTATRGRYTKVGRLVTVQIGIDINNKGTSTGAMNVTGLPFASATFSGGYSGHVGAMRVEGGWTGLTGATIPYIEESGSTTIVIRQGTSTGTNPVTDANTTSGYFFITATYHTA